MTSNEKHKNRSVFSQRLSLLRRASGMTQKQVAQSLSIDRSTYAYYENDKTKPDYGTLARIARIFQVSTDYLLGLTNTNAPSHSIMREPSLMYGGALNGATALSSLSEDEKSFLIMFRQMTADQRRQLLEYALTTVQDQFNSHGKNATEDKNG